MQIKEVEVQTGLTKKAIRYYEEAGLITTTRKENRYKDYSEETVESLLYIKQLRLLDFSVKEIKDLLNDDNQEEIILAKLEANEAKLKQAYSVKQVLEKMLDGESVRTIDVEKIVLEEKKKSYMYIRNNNLIFGLFNLVIFIAIYLFLFSKMDEMSQLKHFFTILMLQMLAILIWSSYMDKRKKEGKKKGILLLEIRPLERLLQFVLHFFTYLLSARMCVEGFYYAGKYIEWGEDAFLVLGNIGMGIFMALFGVAMLIFSFLDAHKKAGEYVL